jgi:FAD:protein FMN transferase
LTLGIATASFLFSCVSIQNGSEVEQECTLNRYEYASIHMGSRCSIVLYAPSEDAAAVAAKHAFDEIAHIEDALTDYRETSEAMRAVSHPKGTWVPVSPVLFDVLDRSKHLYDISEGAFDPTVGRFTHLWRHAKRESRIPSEDELLDAEKSVGFNYVEFDHVGNRVRFMRDGMILDFGAIGKGYAADRAMKVLRMYSFDRALVDVGGDIVLGDEPPDSVDGWDITVHTGVGIEWSAPIHSLAIATSGDLERHYEQNGVIYSHILDPRTGVGVTHRRSVTVIARDGTTSDSVASIVSVLGKQCVPMLENYYPGIQIFIQSGPQSD